MSLNHSRRTAGAGVFDIDDRDAGEAAFGRYSLAGDHASVDVPGIQRIDSARLDARVIERLLDGARAEVDSA
jgi:hypothetical protein